MYFQTQAKTESDKYKTDGIFGTKVVPKGLRQGALPLSHDGGKHAWEMARGSRGKSWWRNEVPRPPGCPSEVASAPAGMLPP